MYHLKKVSKRIHFDRHVNSNTNGLSALQHKPMNCRRQLELNILNIDLSMYVICEAVNLISKNKLIHT